ncbi:MAG: phosphatidate cytidylyltransferase [Treponema sp.]|nr:phosphatidate cytidylyltransferase [Treponema sp.]
MAIKKAVISTALNPAPAVSVAELKTEALRKSIHFLIAFSVPLAALSYPFAVLVLSVGTLGYAIMERLRLSGIQVPLVSDLTRRACRTRNSGGFVLGPVTLGLGALLALLLFPFPAASIAIFALAFGDGLASLIGKFYGKRRPAFLFGKSIEGSAACFAASFTAAWLISRSPAVSLAAALTAAAVEALPLEDYDNIALPLAVGLAVQLAMAM